MSKKDEILKNIMIKNAVKNLTDPKEIEYAVKKLEEMGAGGFLDMTLSKITADRKFLVKMLSAQENLINLVTSCLGAMEHKYPEVFKKKVCDLTDGIKFTIGGSRTLDETDEVGAVLKCVFNDAIYDMHKNGAGALRSMQVGLECMDLLVNCPEDLMSDLAEKFSEEAEMPEDVKEEIRQATENLKKGSETYEA